MFSSLYRSRHLLWELVARDIRSRYTGSLLGLFWSVLNPLLQLVLYTIVFSVFLGDKLGQKPGTATFAALLFCALLPWSAIQESATRSARAFMDQANLVKKARFPLETIPLSLACSALIHQLIATIAFSAILAVAGTLNWRTLPAMIPLLILEGVFMYGLALIFSTVNVFFKDIAHVIGVFFMFLFWLTPIVYPKDAVPDEYLWLLNLNPLTHIVEAFRFAMFGQPAFPVSGLIYWAVLTGIILFLGIWMLSRSRSDILDLV